MVLVNALPAVFPYFLLRLGLTPSSSLSDLSIVNG